MSLIALGSTHAADQQTLREMLDDLKVNGVALREFRAIDYNLFETQPLKEALKERSLEAFMNNDTARREIEVIGGYSRLPAKLTVLRGDELTSIDLRLRKNPTNAVLQFSISIGKVSPREFNANVGTFIRRDPAWSVNAGGDVTLDYRFRTYFSSLQSGKYTAVFRWVEPNFF